MTYQDIINVQTVVQEKSFSKAALKLFVTQSAVSQSIAKLEQELGVTLFLRTSRQAAPTQACLTFIEKARPVISTYEQFCEDMKQLKHTEAGIIHIGVSSFFTRFLAFQKQVVKNPQIYPFKVEITQDLGDVIEQMTVDGELDFCFTRYPLKHSGLQHETLFTEHLYLAVPAAHPVCEKHPATRKDPYPTVSLSEFREDSFVMIKNPSITHRCMKMCQEAGFSPRIMAHTLVWERIYDNVAQLDLVGFISCVYARPCTSRSPVRFFRIQSSYASLNNVVAYISKERLSHSSRTYINAFREYLLPQIPG